MPRMRPACQHAVSVHAPLRQNPDGVLSRLLLRPVGSRAKVEAAPDRHGFKLRAASGHVVDTRFRRPWANAPGASRLEPGVALHDVECRHRRTRRRIVVAMYTAAGFDNLLLQPIGLVAFADLPKDR